MSGLRLLLLLQVLANAGAPTPTPPVGGPEAVGAQVVEPTEPWRTEPWPVVVALVDPGSSLDPAVSFFSRFTRPRGALLLVLPGGDEEALDAALRQVVHDYPVTAHNVVLLARADLAEWARAETLRRYQQVAGLLSIDAPALTLPAGLPGRADLKVALLVTDPRLLEANRQLAEDLRRKAVPCALQLLNATELPTWLTAALAEVLPPAAPRGELRDPVTAARLVAPPGWEFVRRDGLLAEARPVGTRDGLRVEIASGLLGRRSFESYVESTSNALHDDAIELIESTRLTPPDSPTTAHGFYFLDRRGAAEVAAWWALVGRDNRIVSLRCTAPRGELAPRYDQVRQLALGISFEDSPSPQPTPPQP
ncbi:MAG: hypothetical protein IT204_18695 [Fimbriimonadaceae bacterium]|nr:hypothetical protein [Fimbriimonadaceae bacterium]